MANDPSGRLAAIRKSRPVVSGVLDYFPDAIAAVANASYVGNEQHHPGAPLHWDKAKSTDEADCLVRHLMQRGTVDTDGVRHTAKVAWRALALLQREIESESVTHTVGNLKFISKDGGMSGVIEPVFESEATSSESAASYYERVIQPEFDERAGGLEDTPRPLVNCITGCNRACKETDPDLHTPAAVRRKRGLD